VGEGGEGKKGGREVLLHIALALVVRWLDGDGISITCSEAGKGFLLHIASALVMRGHGKR
jgi:hypothetical protein